MHQYRKHDTVVVRAARLSADGRRVVLEIPGIAPVMQMNIRGDLETTDGDEVLLDLYSTIHWLGDTSAREASTGTR